MSLEFCVEGLFVVQNENLERYAAAGDPSFGFEKRCKYEFSSAGMKEHSRSTTFSTSFLEQEKPEADRRPFLL